MSHSEVAQALRALHQVTARLLEAVESGDPTELATALHAREEAFRRVVAVAPSHGDPSHRESVGEILSLDRQALARLRARLEGLGGELGEIRRALDITRRARGAAEPARFVSARV